jgi:hypothetical protein
MKIPLRIDKKKTRERHQSFVKTLTNNQTTAVYLFSRKSDEIVKKKKGWFFSLFLKYQKNAHKQMFLFSNHISQFSNGIDYFSTIRPIGF